MHAPDHEAEPAGPAPRRLRFDSPLGTVELRAVDDALARITLLGEAVTPDEVDVDEPVLARARRQILDYLEGRRRTFDVPLVPAPTRFLESVRLHMMAIPHGRTATYGDLAEAIGDPGAVRAVGQACGSNPLPLIVPCHRVVAAGGLGGFGYGLPCKRWLLRLEGALAQTSLFDLADGPPIVRRRSSRA